LKKELNNITPNNLKHGLIDTTIGLWFIKKYSIQELKLLNEKKGLKK